MIDFQPGQEQQEIVRMARRFSENEVKPVAAMYDEKEEFPWELVEKAYAAGLLHTVIPEKYGGQGLDTLTTAMVTEEIAAGCAAVGLTFMAVSALYPLVVAGTEEQKERLLKPFCTAPTLGALCATEPQYGSDFASIQASAVRDGDSYIINGTKSFITNGGVVGLYLVYARTDKTKRAEGISAFIVPGDAPGLSVGKKEKKMGLRASQTAELHFEEVRVPGGNLVGGEGEGFKLATVFFNHSRSLIGSLCLGLGRAALEAAVNYAKERVQFGKPIAHHQSIQNMLADMAMQVDAARLLVWGGRRGYWTRGSGGRWKPPWPSALRRTWPCR